MSGAGGAEAPTTRVGFTPEERGRLALALAVVAVWLLWAAVDGGYWPSGWGPLGVVLLGALALGVTAFPPYAGGWERARVVLLATLALFVCWSFLSLLWADFRGDAWEGSNKTLASALALAFFAAWRWRPRAAVTLLAIHTLGVGAVGAAVLARAVAGGGEGLGDGRLLGPAGYVNASVALWSLAFWPACFLAASPRVHPALRALLLASAGLLLQLGLLGQSRAWLVMLPLAGLVALALARSRLRLLLAFAFTGAVTAAVAVPLLRVRDAALAGSPEAELAAAGWAAGASAIVLAAAGAAWAVADGRLVVPARARRAAGLAVAVVAAVVLLAAVEAATRAVDDPAAWISARWTDFAHGTYPEDERLGGSLASNRYQHWRIAWAEFGERPLVGQGVDNYYAAYLLRRETAEAEPRYPHSWLLRLLSQVGLVGTALFLAAVSAALVLALRARRRLGPDDALPVVAGLTVFAYWLLHGSVDWFWEFPALAGPALGFLGLATAVSTAPAEARRHGGAPVVAPAVALALVLSASLVLPWLAYAHQRAGVAVWRSEPDLAYARLDRAAQLNPLAGEPLLLKGSIALRRQDLPAAEEALGRVLAREPRNWFAHFQLAVAAALEGDYGRAEARIGRARELNPLDPVVADAAEAIERGEPVSPEALARRFRDLFARRVAGGPSG